MLTAKSLKKRRNKPVGKKQDRRTVDSICAGSSLERTPVIQPSLTHLVHLDGDSAQTVISQCNEAKPIFCLPGGK